MNPDRFRATLAALLIAAAFYLAISTRYTLAPGPEGLPVRLDRWTGATQLITPF